MKDEDKTKDQLINELVCLRQRIAESEELLGTEHKWTNEVLRKNFSIINAVTRSVVCHSTSLQEVLENAVKSMRKNIKEADNILIYLVEEKEAVLKAHSGCPDWVIERIKRIPYPRGATWKTIIDGRPGYIADVEKETVISSVGDEVGIRSYLSMPIHFEGKIVGCININSLKKNAFFTEGLKLMEVVSQQIEMALNNLKRTEALRQSEEQYRTLFDQSPLGVYVFDKEFRITQCNKRFVQILQCSYDKIIGLDIRELKEAQSFIAIVKKALEGGIAHHESLYKATTSSAELWLSVRVSPLRGADGNVIGAMGLVEDITERKMMEELLRATKLESLSVLAGGIAHDFNNLLTGILGNISLAKLYVGPGDKVFKKLTEAEKTCLRTKDLTQQLLTFAKGGVPINKKVTSIAELIKDSASFVLRGSNVTCEFTIPDDLWAVEVDEGQVSQVINNIVINAQQAMSEGGIIKIRAENVIIVEGERRILPLKNGNYVMVSIEDRGIGIPKEYLQKIFDPYFTTKEKGNGLGLASAYSIINKHNGFITVKSETGVGTTLYIYLPASQKEIQTSNKRAKESVLRGRGKILMMDDEEIIREVANEMLTHLGYKVEFAIDGSEAIKLYKMALESRHPFDVVILDLTVPGGMGGKEAVKQLVKIDPKIKAIVSSGYSNDYVTAEFSKCGFRGFVAKPYRIQELSQTLHEVISCGLVNDLFDGR